MQTKQTISLGKIKQDAENNFRQGYFYRLHFTSKRQHIEELFLDCFPSQNFWQTIL